MGGIMTRIQVLTLGLVMLLLGSVAFAQTPQWLWSNGAGSIYSDSGKDIATDSAGNCVVIGYFCDTAHFGNITLTSSGGYDAYVAKMDSNGNWLWANKCGGPVDGGPNVDWGYSVALDNNDNIYITGYFNGSASFGNITLDGYGLSDVFIAKLDINGNWLWAKRAGGIRYDYSNGIAVDSAANVYVTGCFSASAHFGDATVNSFGNMDIFVTKLDTNGNFAWVKGYGGTEHDYGFNLVSDGNGYIFVTGIYRGTGNFDTHQLSSNGDFDVFVIKMSTAGECTWAKGCGGAVADWGYGITVDQAANVFVTGAFTGTITFGSTVINSTGNEDFYVAKMNNNGDWLWAVKAGSTNSDIATDICTDNAGNSYVTGYFTGTISFQNISLTTSGKDYDIAVAALDPNGNWLWAKRGGGTSSEFSYGLCSDDNANLFVTGSYYNHSLFDGTAPLDSLGASDIFVAKLAVRNNVANDDNVQVASAPFELKQNYPNPFNPITKIMVDVQDAKSPYELVVYNVKGRKVCTLHQGNMKQGLNSFDFTGTDDQSNPLPSGVYFYKLSSHLGSETRKMVLTR